MGERIAQEVPSEDVGVGVDVAGEVFEEGVFAFLGEAGLGG